MSTTDKNHRNLSRLWVPIVVLIGILGGVLVYSVEVMRSQFGYQFSLGPLGLDMYREVHIILSTVGIVLLMALIVVYAKTYTETRANFALGLLVVLFALLLQSVLSYPILREELIEHAAITADFSSPIADLFTVIAYAVFLYLSLE